MGNKKSKEVYSTQIENTKGQEIDVDTVGTFSYGKAEQFQVQHFLPPNFPILPVLNASYVKTCTRTWEVITQCQSDRMKQFSKPGIVLYYDEFFYRLFQRDSTQEDVFYDIKKRIGVLIKAMVFLLSAQSANEKEIEKVKNNCRFLGHKHRSFSRVRPHHFSTYASCCVEVIMYWLGEFATPDVGEAWSNLVGFHLRFMMESFLCERIDPYESYQNTCIAAVREITESSGKGSELKDSARSGVTDLSSR